jgi:hypothetical protein
MMVAKDGPMSRHLDPIFMPLGRALLWLALLLQAACGGGGGTSEADTGGAGNGAGVVVDLLQPPVAITLSWAPTLNDTWQWQLSGTLNTGYAVTVYDVDLFETPQATIDALHAAGRHVVCYFSAGSSEDWRSDFAGFAAADMGNPLDGWPGERWLDTRSANVRAVMKARLDMAVAKRCDGVEPDNMDAYTNQPGFALTSDTQLDYNRFIANEARSRGLAVGLKNDVDQLAALEPYFDFAVNEQCHQYDECGGYSVFTAQGKPVFNAEYRPRWVTDAAARDAMCAAARAANLRTLVLAEALDDSLRFSCD